MRREILERMEAQKQMHKPKSSVELYWDVEWEQKREDELARKYFDYLEAEKHRVFVRRLKTFLCWVALFAFALGVAEACRLIVKN